MTERAAEHPNAAFVRRALELVSGGDADVDAVLEMWSDDIAYYAFDSAGPPAVLSSREELTDMMLTGRKMMSAHTYDIVDVRAVGEELVVAQMRMHMTAARSGETVVGDYLGVYRVKHGRIVAACDFLDEPAQEFMEHAWA